MKNNDQSKEYVGPEGVHPGAPVDFGRFLLAVGICGALMTLLGIYSCKGKNRRDKPDRTAAVSQPNSQQGHGVSGR